MCGNVKPESDLHDGLPRGVFAAFSECRLDMRSNGAVRFGVDEYDFTFEVLLTISTNSFMGLDARQRSEQAFVIFVDGSERLLNFSLVLA